MKSIGSKKARLIGVAMVLILILATVLAVLADSKPMANHAADRKEIVMRQTYVNPLKLDQEWDDYGIGDPYILRYDGKYYLYCSTKDRKVGIKAWSSDDLVNWRYEGLVTEEPVSESAYAPEVVYWNGSFYMYTSPAGKGHYVLQSDKPTGPFTVKTGNLGLTIDGSVFIDDDAKWYFTHAGFQGIELNPMSDPFTMGTGWKLNASLGHWTEGSMIIKRNGRYFITFTGNHVFSKGYRVNYGVSHDSPTGPYTIPENNPILISTANDFNGLGHSATVLGPDLDSYYIVYHDLVGHSAEGPPVRRLNLDRLVFNGDKMSVLGPTHGSPQETPALPAFRDVSGSAPSTDKWEQAERDGGGVTWLSRTGTGSRYTAEFNFLLRAGQATMLETMFAYQDSANNRTVRVDAAKKELALLDRENGATAVIGTKRLPAGADLTKLHTIRIESDGTGTRVYWDGLLQLEQAELTARPGRIGYAWPQGMSPELHYTAFANEAGGTSDIEAVKALPGTIEAVHALRVGSPEIRSGITPDGSDAVALSGKDDGLRFPVNVRQDGTYRLAAAVAKSSIGSSLVIETNGKARTIKLDASLFVDDSDWTKVPLGVIELKQGPQWLSLRAAKGAVTLRYVEAQPTVPVPEQSVIKPSAVGLINRFGGDVGWADYEVSFDLTRKEATSDEARILLRTTNESEYRDQVKDGFMGYALSFRNDSVRLTRISYENAKEAASGPVPFTSGQTRRITVTLRGASLSVYADGSKRPILQWTDPNAFLLGRVGLSGASTAWTISPLTVMPLPAK